MMKSIRCSRKSAWLLSACSLAVFGCTGFPEAAGVPGGRARVSCDVVVLGAGGAGLMAAISAQQAGATVAILEKAPAFSATGGATEGAYNAVDPARQADFPMNQAHHDALRAIIARTPQDDAVKNWQEAVKARYEAFITEKRPGLFDCAELYMLQTYSAGGYKGSPGLIKTLAEGAADTLRLAESIGVRFAPELFTAQGGLWPRGHGVRGLTGASLAYIEQRQDKITLYYNTEAVELILSGGRVAGVKANRAGKACEFYAKKAVIITAAEGLVLAEKAGASVTGGWTQFGLAGEAGIAQGVDDCFFVNKYGDRFADEGARLEILAKLLLEQPGEAMWVVFGKGGASEDIEALVQAGKVFQADTVAGLAAQIGTAAEHLQAALDEFNTGAVSGRDRLGRTLWHNKVEAPYYAAPRSPVAYTSPGGLRINEKAQALGQSGQPVPGLYAAGEVTGGIHGEDMLGGNDLTEMCVFGRIAGINAAADSAD